MRTGANLHELILLTSQPPRLCCVRRTTWRHDLDKRRFARNLTVAAKADATDALED